MIHNHRPPAHQTRFSPRYPAMLALLTAGLGIATVTPAHAATIYTQVDLSVEITGTSAVAHTTVTANPQVSAESYTVCVRDSVGANRDFNKVPATITPAGTAYTSHAKTFTAGTYTYWPCLYADGSWHNVGATKQFTVGLPELGFSLNGASGPIEQEHYNALRQITPGPVWARIGFSSDGNWQATADSYFNAATTAGLKVLLRASFPGAQWNGSEPVDVDAYGDFVAAMAARTPARVVTFSVDAEERADVRAADVRLDATGRPSFRLVTPRGAAQVALRLVGAHQVSNALAAAAVGLELGVEPAQLAEVLSAAGPASRWRMEVTDRADGVTVINDAYNANPESMRAGLEALAAISGSTRRAWAVLGGMGELGDTAPEAHAGVGRFAARLGVRHLVAVGAADYRAGYGEGSMLVPDVAAALEVLHERLRPGDVVLVKASRAAGLERIAAGLLADTPAAAGLLADTPASAEQAPAADRTAAADKIERTAAGGPAEAAR